MDEKVKNKINKKLIGMTGAIAIGIIIGLVANSNKQEETNINTDTNYVEDEYGNVGDVTYTPMDQPEQVIDTVYTETELMFQDTPITLAEHREFADSALGEDSDIINKLCEYSPILKDIFDNKGVEFKQERLATRYDEVYKATNIIQGYQIDNTGQYVNLDIRAEYAVDSDIPHSISIRLNNKVSGDIMTMSTISELGYAFGMSLGSEELANALSMNMNSELEYRGRKYSALVFTENYYDNNYINIKIIDNNYSEETSADILLNNIKQQYIFETEAVRADNLKNDINSLTEKLGESISAIERISIVDNAKSEELTIELKTKADKNVNLHRYTDKVTGNSKYGFDMGFDSSKDIDYRNTVKELTKDILGIDVNIDDMMTDGIYKVYLEKDKASIFCIDERLVIASLHSKYVYNYSELYNAFGGGSEYTNIESTEQ